MKKILFGNNYRIVLFIAATVFLAAVASWAIAQSKGALPQAADRLSASPDFTISANNPKWSKAIFTISNMSCGGCIDTIKKSVAGIQGTGNVIVDLVSASAEVLYDAKVVTDPQIIAQAITGGGYPAKIEKLFSPKELQREQADSAEQVKVNIATVGLIDISRKDYEIELEHARSRYEKIYGTNTFTSSQGKQLLQRIQAQIAVRLIDESIKFQEVGRAGHTVSEGKLNNALMTYAKEKNVSLEKLEQDLEAIGYPFDYFKRKFGQRVKLQDYLEKKILSDSVDPDDRQQRYGNWLTNARALAKVTYYDKNIEALVKSDSGGSCGGGSGCSASSR